MKIDDADMAAPTSIMGVSNVITAYLPEKWSRFFPAIPVILGIAYAYLRPATNFGERVSRMITGLLAIGQYSVVRNMTGTKPDNAKV